MPYLNWKESSIVRQDVIAPGESAEAAGERHRLKLGFDSAHREQLLAQLRELLGGQPGPELRLDLPRGWIIFWKLREGESRLLIAHPEAEQWVATVALDREHGSRLLEELKALGDGQAVALGELGPTGSVSNVEVTLELRAGNA